jgi:hypothetical protein
MLIKEDIQKIRLLKSKFHGFIVKFAYKYMNKLFEKELQRHESKINRPKLYTDFQRSLLEIPKWSDKTLKKQYNKFIKWIKRKEDIREEDLYKMLLKIIKGSTQIILNKSDVYVDTLLQDYHFITLQNYYYRCLKRIARRVYENPKDFQDIKMINLIDDLENILQKVLPSCEIKAILEFVDDNNQENDNNIQISYNFDNKSKTDSSISLRESVEKKLVVDKQQSENSLHYVSSDDVAIYNDSDGGLSQILKDVSINQNNEDDDNVKHIRVPKFKKSQYYYNKPKINEINEHFFNE